MGYAVNRGRSSERRARLELQRRGGGLGAAALGVEAELLPVGVALEDVAGDRGAFGLPRDRPLFLFVGRDVPNKGLAHVLGAAADEYHLVVVSDRDGISSPRVTAFAAVAA